MFDPARNKPCWRKLTVEVTPERVRIAWDGATCAEVMRAKVVGTAEHLLQLALRPAPPAAALPEHVKAAVERHNREEAERNAFLSGVHPDYPLRGSLGLLIE